MASTKQEAYEAFRQGVLNSNTTILAVRRSDLALLVDINLDADEITFDPKPARGVEDEDEYDDEAE